jgi:hypothetical protein
MIFQRLRETLHFFWHHLTDLLRRLVPVLPLLALANYRFLVVHGADAKKAMGDPLMLLPQMLAGVLATGLTIRYTLAVVGGGDRGLGTLWGATVQRSMSLVAVQMLAGLAIAAGLLLLIVPGIWLMGVLLPAYVIVMVEQVGALGALQAAWARFRPQTWGVALCVITLALALLVVVSGLESLARLLTDAPLSLQVALVSGLDLVGLLFSQLIGIVLVRFYELEREQAAAGER